jgi:hypothetical protein
VLPMRNILAILETLLMLRKTPEVPGALAPRA